MSDVYGGNGVCRYAKNDRIHLHCRRCCCRGKRGDGGGHRDDRSNRHYAGPCGTGHCRGRDGRVRSGVICL